MLWTLIVQSHGWSSPVYKDVNPLLVTKTSTYCDPCEVKDVRHLRHGNKRIKNCLFGIKGLLNLGIDAVGKGANTIMDTVVTGIKKIKEIRQPPCSKPKCIQKEYSDEDSDKDYSYEVEKSPSQSLKKKYKRPRQSPQNKHQRPRQSPQTKPHRPRQSPQTNPYGSSHAHAHAEANAHASGNAKAHANAKAEAKASAHAKAVANAYGTVSGDDDLHESYEDNPDYSNQDDDNPDDGLDSNTVNPNQAQKGFKNANKRLRQKVKNHRFLFFF